MSDERSPEVLASLPRTRPHRRSDKRGARPVKEAATASAAETATDDIGTPAAAKATPRRAAKPPAAPGSTARAAKPPAKPGSKRTAPKHAPAKPRLRQPAQPSGTPSSPRATPSPAPARKTPPPSSPDILGTAVQAAAELAEIGLSIGARAIRGAVSRLPRR